ncbi:Hypothetical protein I595_3105 [Croceitalea dokdonensis DOKDO 023]|uniref:Uncharacterized protein n=2 Tax=Croceitalea TaxID=574891 RepID=A0A0P7AS01_9FLAO|nr:Hypothetical protein I595_3105 [Croceitalea dokdonensis DOKDO 023]
MSLIRFKTNFGFMKFKWLLFSTFFIIAVHAQKDKRVEASQFTLDVFLPGASYEMGIAENSTISLSGALGFAYRESAFFESGYGVYPIIVGQYRYYYNFQRRLDRDKRIKGNTGNYLAPTIFVQGGNPIIGNLEATNLVGLAAVYGIQRTGKKGFQWNFNVGPSVYRDDFGTEFGIFLDFKLGFVLGYNR